MTAKDLWRQWCRLCAKDDPAENVNVFLQEDLPASSQMLIKTVLKCFNVEINPNSKLPQILCNECVCLVNSLMKFAERVTKVQEMFHALHTSVEVDNCNLDTLLQKFGLFEEQRKQQLSETKVWGLEASTEKFVNENIDEPELDIKAEFEEMYDSDVASPSQTELANAASYEQLENKTKISSECANKYDNATTDADETEHDEMENTLNDDETGVTSRATQIYEFLTMEKSLPPKCGNDEADICDKSRTEEEDIDQELLRWLDHPNEFGAYICSECSRKFQQYNGFRQHLKRNHKLSPNLKCPRCAKNFLGKGELRRHFCIHVVPLELRKIFDCKLCDNRYPSIRQLNVHIKRVHLSKREYVCHLCQHAFHTNVELKIHLRRHSVAKPFGCNVCKKQFKVKTTLKVHMETHSANPRRHICEKCGHKAPSDKALRKHTEIHSNVYAYKCDFCDQRFKRSSYLRNHLIFHTGMKPFKCNFCQKSYTSSASMRTHRKVAHSEELKTADPATLLRQYNAPSLEELKIALKAADSVLPLRPKKLEVVETLTNKEYCARRQERLERRAKTSATLEKLINETKQKKKFDHLSIEEVTCVDNSEEET